jgi:hypothetical protein
MRARSRVPGERLVAQALLCIAAMPLAAQADGERLSFVSCPIVRDTSTVPCWLAEYAGELYYLGIQTDVSADFHPPYLGHQVLVEGVVSDAPRICGGIVLDPVKTSVMPELDGSCNVRLPAEERYTIDFNPRPPGPSGGRLAFQAPAPEKTVPAPPFETREFLLTYDFDRRIGFGHPRQIMAIAEYAQAVKAKRVRVHGSRGAMLLSDGTLLTESEAIARRRAEQIAHLLEGVGVEAAIEVDWTSEPAAADGVEDWRSRSVSVAVEP